MFLIKLFSVYTLLVLVSLVLVSRDEEDFNRIMIVVFPILLQTLMTLML